MIVDDSSKSQLIVKLKSEGDRAAPYHSSQLIVASINSEISFHFCDNCRIFREGVKGAMAIPNGLFGRNLAFGLISAFGQNLAFSRTTAFGLITAFGYITVGCCIALQLHHSPNCLAAADGLIVKINDLLQTEMFYSTNGFQLVVNSIVILNCDTVSEGANAVPAIFCDRSSKYIVVSNSEGEISKAESECFGINGQISLTELIVTSMFGRSNQSLLNDDFQLVVKLIPILTSEGARAPSSFVQADCRVRLFRNILSLLRRLQNVS